MATVDEILDAMPDEQAEAGREYLTIDPLTRTITVPDSEKVFAVTGDEYADRKYFRCPRIVGDGLDLAAMFLRVNYRNAGGDEDGYLVDDVAVAGDYVTFSWRLWPKVAEYKGSVQFAVCADLPDTEDRKMPDWNTTLASGEVLEGMHPYDGAVEEETSDVVTQLRAMTAAQTGAVEAVGAQQVQAVQEAAETAQGAAVAAVQAQGAATVASIPADYTALAATVDRLTRDRAAAIVCEARGSAIQVNDASADPLQGLRIFGRSTQDGTPTPEAPVEIKSLAAPVVRVCGKNLLPYPYTFSTRTMNGVTFTDNGDGSITANGTASGGISFHLATSLSLPAGRYVISGCPDGGSLTTYRVYYSDNTSKTVADYGAGSVFTLDKPFTGQVVLQIISNAVINNLTFRPMIYLAEIEDGTYEPYTGQTLAITTPGNLPGIPVTSGGNYTDENGQQWIADEVDLARGVYVQRVGVETKTITFDSQDTSGRFLAQGTFDHYYKGGGSPCVCSVAKWYAFATMEKTCCVGAHTLYYKNASLTLDEANALFSGIKLQVAGVLTESVEKALTDAEIQAFRALHSVKPTTTVLTDTGAHMALEYAADPKTYIDNKLAALVAAAAN